MKDIGSGSRLPGCQQADQLIDLVAIIAGDVLQRILNRTATARATELKRFEFFPKSLILEKLRHGCIRTYRHFVSMEKPARTGRVLCGLISC
jgi:hypothetical protein